MLTVHLTAHQNGHKFHQKPIQRPLVNRCACRMACSLPWFAKSKMRLQQSASVLHHFISLGTFNLGCAGIGKPPITTQVTACISLLRTGRQGHLFAKELWRCSHQYWSSEGWNKNIIRRIQQSYVQHSKKQHVMKERHIGYKMVYIYSIYKLAIPRCKNFNLWITWHLERLICALLPHLRGCVRSNCTQDSAVMASTPRITSTPWTQTLSWSNPKHWRATKAIKSHQNPSRSLVLASRWLLYLQWPHCK